MTNAPQHLDLSQELAATADWDDTDDLSHDPGHDPGHDPVHDPADAWPDERDETTGELDLAARHSLRRVAGLSTELEDITEVEYRQLRLERVVLVGVWTEGTVADAENSMAELALLAET